ncbi:MAG: type II toxin-antitoxin system RelB/DinJ family antitoxin [Acidobacteriaceae bacterium]|nr:type II toxin-antitoxin system RelB/DinJ family antitoxin [Acidobacteriaceae bacterium]
MSALQRMGLSASDLIRLTFFRVAEEGRLPFAVEVPNATTRRAMAELVKGGGKRYENAEEMFEDLGI